MLKPAPDNFAWTALTALYGSVQHRDGHLLGTAEGPRELFGDGGSSWDCPHRNLSKLSAISRMVPQACMPGFGASLNYPVVDEALFRGCKQCE